MKLTRHLVIPDRQAKPGVPLDHNIWIGKAIARWKPDVVIDLGDAADFESISTHDAAGSKSKEGKRLAQDIETANRAEELLNQGMGNFRPKRKIKLFGNHEHRVTRFIEQNPVLEGLIGLHLLNSKDWEIVPYYEGQPGVIRVDGVRYAHYFHNPNTGKPIAGTIGNRLAKIGGSFVQGHQQGLSRGDTQLATGETIRGVVAGSCYLHNEGYKGQANKHWRGIVLLNEVADGEFLETPISLNSLCGKFEGTSVARFLQRKYRNAKQRFSLAA